MKQDRLMVQRHADDQLASENQELQRLLLYAKRRIRIVVGVHAVFLVALMVWIIHYVGPSASIPPSGRAALDTVVVLLGALLVPEVVKRLFARNFSNFQQMSKVLDLELRSDRYVLVSRDDPDRGLDHFGVDDGD